MITPLVILISYLIGAFPSAYLIGRLWGRVDLRQEGDGHISATAVYRYLGLKAFIPVLVLDIGKGVLSVYIASLFTPSAAVLVVAALAAIIGHSWSVFLKFKGGLGGTVMFGTLVSLALKEVGFGIAVFLITLLFSRKTSLGTWLLLLTVSVALFIEHQELVKVFFPIGIIILQLLKRLQMRITNPASNYKNEALDDLKRVR